MWLRCITTAESTVSSRMVSSDPCGVWRPMLGNCRLWRPSEPEVCDRTRLLYQLTVTILSLVTLWTSNRLYRINVGQLCSDICSRFFILLCILQSASSESSRIYPSLGQNFNLWALKAVKTASERKFTCTLCHM